MYSHSLARKPAVAYTTTAEVSLVKLNTDDMFRHPVRPTLSLSAILSSFGVG
jgi:hypothetical protein